jgi:hypothetical protein
MNGEQLRTRPVRHLDLLALRSLSSEQANKVIGPLPFEAAPGVVKTTLFSARQRVWVAETGRSIVGFAQACPRRYVLGWELVRVSVRARQDPSAALAALIQEVLAYLQGKAIPRLFARTPAESPAHEMLLECGFTHLLSETVFLRPSGNVVDPQDMPTGMRFRMPQDAWPLRQLENSQTPLLVSQLEGLTSLNWSTMRQLPFSKDEPTELVIERDGEIVGWAGWSILGEFVRLGLLSVLDDPDVAAALLEYALNFIAETHPTAQVIVRVRDYQDPLSQTLVDHGFGALGRETLHIKHGRLQMAPAKTSRLFDLAPSLRTLTLERNRASAMRESARAGGSS